MSGDARDLVGAALATAGPEPADTGEIGDAMLVGWVVVSEWVAADDGRRWLSKLTGDVNGEPLTVWAEQGYLHNALLTSWDDAPPADD